MDMFICVYTAIYYGRYRYIRIYVCVCIYRERDQFYYFSRAFFPLESEELRGPRMRRRSGFQLATALYRVSGSRTYHVTVNGAKGFAGHATSFPFFF